MTLVTKYSSINAGPDIYLMLDVQTDGRIFNRNNPATGTVDLIWSAPGAKDVSARIDLPKNVSLGRTKASGYTELRAAVRFLNVRALARRLAHYGASADEFMAEVRELNKRTAQAD